MGYDPDPDRLETVFTGRISQVQMGQVVQIIAQGYKTELLNELSFKAEDESYANIVRTIFQHLDGEGHYKDLNDSLIDERKNGTPHLGTRVDMASPEQRKEHNRTMKYLFGQDVIYGSGGFHNTGPFGFNFLKVFSEADVPEVTVDGRSYIDLFSAKPSRYRNINLKAFVEDKKDFWVTTYQPGFDALLEMTSFMPGWVCDVVDYDHLATLYIGPPEGEYFWTSKYNKSVITSLRRRHEIRKSVENQRHRIVSMLDRFNDFVGDWITDKRRGSSYDKRELSEFRGRLREEWLPDEFRERSVQPIYNDLRHRSEAVTRAFVGAFFGFDMVSNPDFPPQISSQLWTIIGKVIGYEGKARAGGLRVNLGGDAYDEISLHTRESAERTIEYIVENTPGFRQRLYQMSFFNDQRLQEAVGRLTFLRREQWNPKVVEVTDLAGISQWERYEAASGMALNDSIARGGAAEVDLAEEQGIVYKHPLDTPWAFIPGVAPARTLLQGIDGQRVLGHVYRVPLYPPRNLDSEYGSYVIDHVVDFKVFIYLLHKFLDEEVSTEDVQMMVSDLADYRNLFKAPDRRPFRQYHHVTSRYDIIENNIVASTKEMANAVLLRHPAGEPNVEEVDSPIPDAPKVVYLDESDTDWTAFKHPDGVPYHPDLKLEQKKLAVSIEKNATTKEQAASVFLSRMGDALRPMYRGNLVLWGRMVKPHDVIFINDDYNSMEGPVEVERCIHHFTPQTGWTTTIVPHAFVHVDNSIDVFQASVLEKWLGILNTTLDVVNWGAIILSFMTLGLGSVVKSGVTVMSALTKKALNSALKKTVRKEITKNVTTTALSATGAAARGLAVRKAMARMGTNQLSKAAGKDLAPMFKNGLRSIAVWGGVGVASAITQGYSTSIATSGSKELQGIVSITPLIFEGRPLVAGLDYDDRYYLSQIESFWEYFSGKLENAVNYVEREVKELFTTPEGPESFNVVGPHRSVK
jgi:hypothetical protein